MQRLVTQQDLIDNPDLIKRGVSVNQHWDFPSFEQPASLPKHGIGFDPFPGVRNFKANPDFKPPVEENKPTPEAEMELAKMKIETPKTSSGWLVDTNELKLPAEEPPVTNTDVVEEPKEKPVKKEAAPKKAPAKTKDKK